MLRKITPYIGIAIVILMYTACTPALFKKVVNKNMPTSYYQSRDSTNTAKIKWKDFFNDPFLNALIDTALKNNQELNIVTQEINIARNEVRARKGEYLPFLHIGGATGLEKSGRYTRPGAVDATTEIAPGKPIPDPLPDFLYGLSASWEIDIWKKLRNAKNAAAARYLASVEGKNFVVTQLVAEIAKSYYELLALDNQLDIVKKNIELQSNALEIVKMQKEATRVTELAVRKFEAEVFHTQSLQYDIQQKIIETENKINFLIGRYPQAIARNTNAFNELIPTTVYAGIPSQLLQQRPDIKRAELQLAAANLEIKVARANFYPSLNIRAGAGYQAFNPKYLVTTPASALLTIAGDLAAPLINRNAIKATYLSANAKQIQAAYNYERTVLNAFIEVTNQLSRISNLEKSYDLKTKQVLALTQSIDISTGLFKSARADYMEVLMTQRDALASKFELIETKKLQLNAMVNIYQALGGGWN